MRAVDQTARAHGYEPRILPAVDAVNEGQKEVLFSKIKNRLGDLSGKQITIWGLAFKPNTDDIREASSLVLIRRLLKAGARVKAHDPEAMKAAQAELSSGAIGYYEDPYEALNVSDALAIATEWKAFRSPDFSRLKNALKTPIIFDGRNLFDIKDMGRIGIEYHSVGRPVSNKV